MALDHRCGAVGSPAFDDVGVQGALHEERGIGDAAGVSLEDAYEGFADDLALPLGVGDAGKVGEELVGRIDVHELDADVALERFDHLRAFVLAHEPGVDVHARELRTDRPVHECCRHRRVDASRETADDPRVADLRTNCCDLALDDRVHRPLGSNTRALVEERLDHRLTRLRVHHLGVVLNAPHASLVVFEHGHRCFIRRCRDTEALRRADDRVEVTHPHVGRGGNLREKTRFTAAVEGCATVFTAIAALDRAAQLLRNELTAVTDSENRNAEVVDRRIELRRSVDVHALRPARQDDRRGPAPFHLGGGDAVRNDLRVHPRLPHPAGDELRVLGTEVDDEDCRWARHRSRE